MGQFDLFKSIFPIYLLIKDNNNNYVDAYFLGSCFYCKVANNKIIVTTKHILKQLNDNEDLALAYKKNNKPEFLSISGICTHNVLDDFSFFIPGPNSHLKLIAEEYFAPLNISKKLLALGTDVISFGYPLSSQERLSPYSLIVNINPMIFKGYIHSIWDKSPNQKFGRIYGISFPALSGLCGSPLMVGEKGGDLVVTGIIHQHQSLHRTLESKIESKNNDNTIIETNYLSYEIGISSDFQPFVKIEELLKDISKKLIS